MIIGISGKIGSGKDTIGTIIQYLCSKTPYKTENIARALELGGKHLDIYPHFTSVEIRKFADELKDTLCRWIGCSRKQLEDRTFKNKELREEWWYYIIESHNGVGGLETEIKPYLDHQEWEDTAHLEALGLLETSVTLVKPTPRLLLQRLGTEAGRQVIHPNVWVNALMCDYQSINIAESLAGGDPSEPKQVIKYPNWVITDCRFPNEAQAVKSKGGILIRVNRTLRTSEEWQRQYPKVKVLDPDGWDRTNYDFSFKKELISLEEYYNRVIRSTCKFSIQDIQGHYFTEKPHPSETALDDYKDWDYVIENNGTIEELIEKVRTILKSENII